MSSRLDLEAKRGDTWYWEFAALQNDQTTPQDITGATFRFTTKLDLDDDDSAAIVVGTTSGGECQVIDAPGGLVTVKIPSSVTVAVESPAVLYYDLQARDGAGDVWTIAQGKLKVTRDVSITVP